MLRRSKISRANLKDHCLTMTLALKFVKEGAIHLHGFKQFLSCTAASSFSTTCSQSLDQRWRKQRKLPENPNAYGPLTNLPDYSYHDAKPVPVGSRMYKRLLKQREYAEKIVTLSKEMDFAVEWDKQLKLEEENAKQKILERKLKPKGHLLLKK